MESSEATHPTPGGPGAQLSFALHGAANRVVRLHKPLLEPLGLTFPQYLALLALLENAPQTVGELGAGLDMDTGTITPLLKRLEASGMATRTRDPADERRVLVDLTTQARALESQLHSIPDQIRTACKLTPAGMVQLRHTLHDLAHPADH